MPKKVKVDVAESLGYYQEHGRLSPATNEEVAAVKGKLFTCSRCGYEVRLTKREFGEENVCPKCKEKMLENL